MKDKKDESVETYKKCLQRKLSLWVVAYETFLGMAFIVCLDKLRVI
jgi:hypothetical protein